MDPERSVFLPATRDEALNRLSEFLAESAGKYADTRNHVLPGHGNVSRLSTATRTRLLLESEICEAAREKFSAGKIEKFEQEIWWRLYWKGWLELRPSIWTDYINDLSRLEWSNRATEVAAGRSGVAMMDHFAKELIETGYLHNHARMWWASFWIHIERLPWQLGADFFQRHLLDGDAASNTLSWRWVAGLQTRGKSYLVRRSNLERYVEADLLSANSQGLSRLENPSPAPGLDFEEHPNCGSVPLCEDPALLPAEGLGIWIHDEDLLLEKSPLAGLHPKALLAPLPLTLWEQHNYSDRKREFLTHALSDGTSRAASHFDLMSGISNADDLGEALVTGAKENGLSAIVAMQPFTGPLTDELPRLTSALEKADVSLHLIRRDEDTEAMQRATAGFFGFWKKTSALRERLPL